MSRAGRPRPQGGRKSEKEGGRGAEKGGGRVKKVWGRGRGAEGKWWKMFGKMEKMGYEKFFWKSVDMGFWLRIIRSRSPLRGCEASG